MAAQWASGDPSPAGRYGLTLRVEGGRLLLFIVDPDADRGRAVAAG